ncbi:substrate-binding domain-containing protein [Treponema sp. J25]|jgi:ribose transport system substrate-binding protein|uniref:substrate-binding domain-containing protein n=1 Tax=Treponema sp. J25 TaxID=2094121 RepID=UPI001049C015|nr:substrate-binding domain-containing protein [Treponema sp. J25]TCW61128.1 LacI family transcriptional regulator [Treponema sp. J25]
MKRRTVFIVPAILLFLLFTGIFIILYFTRTPFPQKEIRVVAVLKTIDTNMEFWEVVKTAMRMAANELGIGLEIVGPPDESDIESQIRIMEAVIQQKPSVIILAATDRDRLVPLVEKAHSQRIPVITLDSGVKSPLPRTFVATNNVEAARELARYAQQHIPPGSMVAIVNHIPGATTAIEREQGVRSILEKDPRFTIIGTYFTDNFEENAYTIARSLMNQHPRLRALLAMNEVSVIGCARAIRDLGKKGVVQLYGFDNSLVEVQFLEEGVLNATVIQRPFSMGYLSVQIAADVLRGKTFPSFTDTGSVLITPENMYYPEHQKLLFPFVK